MAPEMVWVVSFAVSENGEFLDYDVNEFDLARCSNNVAGQLRELAGKGVFDNIEEAEDWGRAQMHRCGCHGHTGAGRCQCPKSKGVNS